MGYLMPLKALRLSPCGSRAPRISCDTKRHLFQAGACRLKPKRPLFVP